MEYQELEIIRNMRAEVMSRKDITGANLFLAWGYPTAIVLASECVALQVWHTDWCSWLWMGIPLIGTPLMVFFLKKDYARTKRRTLDEKVILTMWIYLGLASCIGGAAMGFAGVFEACYCAYQGVLVSLGCFMTGIINHFRPKTICGIIASPLSAVPLFLQGDLWPWQLLVVSLIAIVTLIVPGHLYRQYVKNYYESI